MSRTLDVGKVLAPRGLHGGLKVRFFRTDPAVLDAGRISVSGKTFDIERSSWIEVSVAVLSLRDVSDRDAAEALRGAIVSVDLDWFGANDGPSDRLIGARVADAESGEEIGVVSSIFENGAHELLVIGSGAHERMIPLVDAFIVGIDADDRGLIVHAKIIPGLL